MPLTSEQLGVYVRRLLEFTRVLREGQISSDCPRLRDFMDQIGALPDDEQREICELARELDAETSRNTARRGIVQPLGEELQRRNLRRQGNPCREVTLDTTERPEVYVECMELQKKIDGMMNQLKGIYEHTISLRSILEETLNDLETQAIRLMKILSGESPKEKDEKKTERKLDL